MEYNREWAERGCLLVTIGVETPAILRYVTTLGPKTIMLGELEVVKFMMEV